MSALTPLLLIAVLAQDIWIRENPDGTLTFTDSPPARSGYTVLLREKPLPAPSAVSLRSFPALNDYDTVIAGASLQYGVPAPLIKAVALAESGMNPRAISPAGAQGLMQLMPGTARELAVVDPFDPTQAIDGGARYLARQLNEFGSTELALAAYNAGPGAVKRHNGIPPIPETQEYVVKVMALYNHFRGQQDAGSGAP
ncbi:lytic transglycosylase domain-containing protein [Myxococcota bacterium]|nr:lytic transglycosylase domain-containing protein [Myxococcota bacterium]